MIMRVYAMWNQSKRILYSLLFICVPQVIATFVYQGIYHNPNTYLSGMSQAKLQAKPESYMWSLASYHLFLQSQLFKLWISLFAIIQ
jgi:hypothetical protein